jgi:poly-gamma-glutamate synthesis protein (capsule biosynthesis protein)
MVGVQNKPTSTSIPATSTIMPTATTDPLTEIKFYRGDLPSILYNGIVLPGSVREVNNKDDANIWLSQASDGKITWVYALVAPFPTIVDNVSLDEIKQTWQGKGNTDFQNSPLLMSEQTKGFFEYLWGPADSTGVKVLGDDEILSEAWNEKTAWAIVPFENLEPRWKVLRVDGLSPLYKTLELSKYPLTIRFGFSGDAHLIQALTDASQKGMYKQVETNWDVNKMTTVLMTGTTTLARMVGLRMEQNGITWPGKEIRAWMTEPDFTHISNEASFYDKCPEYDPWYITTTFCSKPENIQLFEDLGVNIIELTGNHLLDFGYQPLLYTLDLYAQHGWKTFGGGINAEQAREPLLIEKNSNKIAFIGCNNSGNSLEWATNEQPGAAHCDFDWMSQEIASLKKQGYIVLATLQDLESYSPMPLPYIRDDFTKVAGMGADIVSGSQAHFPQGFEFYNSAFIHYGLGNLFFDQMDYPVVGTRREFLDRYVFYNGKYISTELLTAMLEDYAQPRPMTSEERSQFLLDIFKVSNW